MDKELNSIADGIIKDGFGSGSSAPAPSAPTSAGEPVNPSAPATPKDTFTAEIPQMREPAPRPAPTPSRPSMPVMGGGLRPRTTGTSSNEYSRIKEQMSAAREASGLSSLDQQAQDNSFVSTPIPERGLNKAILLFIIFIPVLVVSAGIFIALLNQPSGNDNSQNQNQAVQYKDPRDTATEIDLTTATGEIQINEAGYYLLTGTTTFPVKVKAPGKVTLYLHNVSITATDASAIANYSENPLEIFLDDDTESTLAVTTPEAFDSIYSEGDLTIDGGTGILNVAGIKIVGEHHYDVTGNGIKDSKSGTAIPPETTEETQPEVSQDPEARPAEGESNFQSGAPTEPVGENIDPGSAGPANN